jgi:hypothetical protein
MDETVHHYSTFCQTVALDGKAVAVRIYNSVGSDWILEVVDPENNSVVWDNHALAMFERILQDEGAC